ncbi:LCP family protein [Salinispira pacifica]
MKRARLDNGLILLLLIVMVIAGLSVYLYFQVRTDRVTSVLQGRKEIRVLFIVADGDKPLFTDVLLYNPTTKRSALFDIPGNIGSIINSLNRIDRIDLLYKKGHVDEYKRKIQDLLNIDIPFYWIMSPKELSDLTDLMGGLNLFIANSVEQVTEKQMTLLPAGNVTLDGSKIDTYLTLHSAGSDAEAGQNIDRFERERKIMQAFLKGLGDKADYLTNEHVFPFLASRVSTNMDGRALKAFIREMAHMDERMVSQRVLGDLKSVEGSTGGEKLLFPYFEGQLLKDAVRQVQSSLSSQDMAFADVGNLKLQILNGTSIPGLAARTKELYQSYGFQNVLVGNAESTGVDKTIVIDHKGSQAAAQRVAEIIRAHSIVKQPDDPANPDVDVTIVLGSDFDGWYVK